MTNTPITSAQSRDYDIKKCLIYSNDGKIQSDIGGLISDLFYYESVLSPTLKVDVMFADTGTVKKDGELKTVIDALEMIGTEKVELVMSDPNEKDISVTLYVDNVSPISQETRKSLVSLNLVSKEAILNYYTRARQRYDGKVEEHIKRILTEVLKVDTGKKKLDFDETLLPINYCSTNWRPIPTILNLAKKGVPKIQNAQGNTAGFFFFETSEGFKFKSVDGLLSDKDPNGNKKKHKSFVYNDTPDGRGGNIPPEYSGKILEYNVETPSGNVQSKLQIGTYSTKTILFDPFSCYYEVVNPNTQGDIANEESLQKAAKSLPKYNKEFNIEGEGKNFSRVQYMLTDTGTLPTGDTKQQIKKSKEKNFDAKNILNQSVMRYNQFFSTKVTVTISSDFSLHAGDYVFVDAPEISVKETKTMDQTFGGYYVIADLCHYISKRSGAYTKLTLVRDSLGRKGSPLPLNN